MAHNPLLTPYSNPDAFFAAVDDNLNRRRHHDVWDLADMLHEDNLRAAMTPVKLEKVERERLEALERYEIKSSAKKKSGLWDREKTEDEKSAAPSQNRRRVVAKGRKPIRVSADGTMISVLDVIGTVTGTRHPKKVWERLCATHPEVKDGCTALPNPRGRASWYAPPEHVLFVLSFLPGKEASAYFSTFLQIVLRRLRVKITVTPSGVTVQCANRELSGCSSDENAPDEPGAEEKTCEAESELDD